MCVCACVCVCKSVCAHVHVCVCVSVRAICNELRAGPTRRHMGALHKKRGSSDFVLGEHRMPLLNCLAVQL